MIEIRRPVRMAAVPDCPTIEVGFPPEPFAARALEAAQFSHAAVLSQRSDVMHNEGLP
jgi:hypothetical protein